MTSHCYDIAHILKITVKKNYMTSFINYLSKAIIKLSVLTHDKDKVI